MKGIICKRCGGDRWSVAYVRKTSGAIERRRECVECSLRITTTEKEQLFSDAIYTGIDEPKKDASNNSADC